MQSTPDLSGIINLIMQNPSLIEQISALAKPKEESESTPEDTENPAVLPEETAEETVAVPRMRTHRHELLSAMKPYLSENRRAAIDSMSSILDVIDVMMKKQ